MALPMLIQINYLGNHASVDVGPFISALCTEVAARPVDPRNLLVTLDWIQYRQNFRAPVATRRYISQDGEPLPEVELAVDARRIGQASDRALATALDDVAGAPPEDRVYLEE